MNGASLDPNMDRLMELLADRAVQGLSPAEADELRALVSANPDLDEDDLDLAAAALDLAMIGPVWGTMPDSVAERVSASARSRLPSAAVRPAPDGREGDGRGVIARVGPVWKLGWVAAAACAVIAAAAWWPRVSGEMGNAGADRFAALESVPDLVRVAWQPGNDPAAAGARGEVLWSPSRQAGFMVFEGLAANDPSVEQFQLWIFDRDRDEAAPVHGGVFDVRPDEKGRCVVRFEPRLGVKDATLFAVTVERPGGVWVSKRERIPVLASVNKS